MARPPFWRMTIWIDVIFFGPFYLFAIYAFIRGRNWIRRAGAGLVGHDDGQRPDHPDGGEVRRDAGARTSGSCSRSTCRGCSCRSLMMWRMRRDHPFTPAGAGPTAPDGRSRPAPSPGGRVTGRRDRRPRAVRGAVRAVGAGRRRVGGPGRGLRHRAGRAGAQPGAGRPPAGARWRRSPPAADPHRHRRRRSRHRRGSRRRRAPPPPDVEVGLVVANAAYSPIGRFLDLDAGPDAARAVDLNCRAPLALAHHFLPAMVARGRGGFVVMSSLAGMQGSPPISVYAATKAFGAILAEGLWAELRGIGRRRRHLRRRRGGNARTRRDASPPCPGHAHAGSGRRPPRCAAWVAARGPFPVLTMRVSSAVMSRLLPRRTAIAVIARASRDLAPPA